MLTWQQFRPFGKWLVVKADPRVKKTKGGILLTESITGVERVMEGTGQVLKIGPDVNKTIGYGMEIGMRICYRGFLKDAFAEFLREEDNCPIFLLRAEDIMAVIDDSVQMGAFS